MIYLKYLWYVLKHKWFVFLECCKMGVPWRGFIHDWTKFLPCEFVPYARHFYGDIMKGRDETGAYDPTAHGEQFARAWLHHERTNKHHWQWWVQFKGIREGLKVYEIPDVYMKEMLADWRGAGRAQGKGDDVREWFLKQRGNMWLHDNTARWIYERLGIPITHGD